MARIHPKFDPAGWLGALREWIVETTIESRMARLSTLGMQLTVTRAAVTGEYVFVDTVKSKTYTATVGKAVTVAASGAISYA